MEQETVKAKQEENFSGALLSSVQSNAMEKPVIILKRPDSHAQREALLQSNARPKTQVKSLHQRQQEYAEARMRILGSMPTDDGDFQAAAAVQSSTTAQRSNGIAVQQATTPTQPTPTNYHGLSGGPGQDHLFRR